MAKRKAATSRSSTRATSRKSSATADVEVVEEADGAGIDLGIIVITSLVLVIGLAMLDMIMSKIDGSGIIM